MNCEGWLHFQAMRYNAQGKSRTMRDLGAQHMDVLASRPVSNEKYTALLRKFPSVALNHKTLMTIARQRYILQKQIQPLDVSSLPCYNNTLEYTYIFII